MMPSRTSVIAALVAVGIVAIAVTLIRSPPSVVLVADTAVPVYDVASADPAGRRVIDTIEVGESVAVTSCTDLKHYLVPEVLLPDGRRGYVIDGRFHFRNARTAEVVEWPVRMC